MGITPTRSIRFRLIERRQWEDKPLMPRGLSLQNILERTK